MGNIVYPLSLIYSAALISSQGISETLIPENKSFLSGTWLCLSYLTLSHGFLFPRSVILKSMFPRPAALVSLETYKKFKFTVLIPGLLNQKPLVWGLAISVLTSPLGDPDAQSLRTTALERDAALARSEGPPRHCWPIVAFV